MRDEAMWVTSEIAGRLIGADKPVLEGRALQCRYGPTRRTANGEILVSTTGLGMAARTRFTETQIQAAQVGKPLPKNPFAPLPSRRYSRDEIGFAVVLNEGV
jgi:hypothetical protein